MRLMTEESGCVASSYQTNCYPFGMRMDDAPPSSWLSTGREKNAATGLDYMPARMHSETAGSFTIVERARGSSRGTRPVVAGSTQGDPWSHLICRLHAVLAGVALGQIQ
ncbi:MAG: hypothetical protein D6738_07275 [Acidobacteria bacterium]|nr:MAG: hypothetical protein D6738_07275 [Acidobacteriota bacterium]